MSRSLLELAVGLRNGTVTSVELTEAAIRAHEAKDFGAYKIFDKVRALEYAREADKRLKTGSAPPLCGLPFSIKDLYGTKESVPKSRLNFDPSLDFIFIF